MASYQQCTFCNKFLLSTDPVPITNHALHCLNPSVEDNPKPDDVVIENSHDTLEKENFRWITFPDVRIHLIRTESSSTSPTWKEETQGGNPRGPGPKRKRNRYPTPSIAKSNEEDQAAPFIRQYRFDCDQCPGKFYSKVEYDRHMNVHNGTRRIMECIVCLRMFNKRDSLNQHYASHENAEEREETLNLMDSWPQKTTDNPYARIRQACKYCLMVHTNQQSFVNHIKTDHSGKSSYFPCTLNKCAKIFTKIRELLQHAKEVHPLSFYGKFTLNRLQDGFVLPLSSIRRAKAKESATNKADKNKTPGTKKPKSNNKSKKRRKKKMSLAMSQYQSDSDEEDDDDVFNFSGPSTRVRIASGGERLDRTVELERVHIVDTGEDGLEDVVVKQENSKFYSCQQVEFDPFFMHNLTTGGISVPSGVENDGAYSDNESVPIVLGIKTEPII